MTFPSRDLTSQYISSSYQDVLQQYLSANYLYVLDGYGNVVFSLPSASVGNVIITSDITASMTSSYLYGTGTIIGGLQFDTASATEVNQEGYIFWDNDSKTLAIKPDITASTLQIGQETWLRYVAGEDISNGDALYISTNQTDPDGHPVCKRAIADATRTKYGVVALATNAATSGSHNLATIVGIVNDLNTVGIPNGAPLFLSDTVAGGYRLGVPEEPHERVLLGYCSRQDATAGRIFVGIIGIPDVYRPFAGVTDIPSITNNGDGTVTIGTGSVALNTLSTGKGNTRVWQINSSSFSIPIGLTDVNYIVANYNAGSPRWELFTGSTETVDNIQIVKVYTITRALSNSLAWASWDEPGILLANKLMERHVEVHGIERTSGMILGESGSRYVTVTSGSFWSGVSKNTSNEFNSTSSALILLYHSSSTEYTASQIYQYINNRYDTGTTTASLTPNRFVVNYVYKSATNQNRCMIMLSNQYQKLVDAQASQPPSVPGDLLEGGILVGRAIYETGLSTATQIDSAFSIQFTPSSIITHNDLSGLQGGTVDEYYHLTANQHTAITSVADGYKTISASYVITSSDYVVYASASTSSFTVTMPSATAVPGRLFKIKKIDHTGYEIIITGSQNIDYDTELRLSQRGSSVTLHSDNAQYWIH